MCSKVTKCESPVILKVQQKLAGAYRMFVKVADTLIQLSSSSLPFRQNFWIGIRVTEAAVFACNPNTRLSLTCDMTAVSLLKTAVFTPALSQVRSSVTRYSYRIVS